VFLSCSLGSEQHIAQTHGDGLVGFWNPLGRVWNVGFQAGRTGASDRDSTWGHRYEGRKGKDVVEVIKCEKRDVHIEKMTNE